MSRKGQRYLTVLLLTGMTFLLSGCTEEELFSLIPETACLEQQIRMDGKSAEADSISEKWRERRTEEKEPQTQGFLMEEAGSFAYESLSEAEQIWYRDMEKILGGMEAEGQLSEEGLQAGLDESCIDTVFQCVMNDHPELFYVEGYHYNQYFWGDDIVRIAFSGNYSMDAEEAAARNLKIKAAVANLTAQVPEDASEYDKVKYVYETLIENTEYDLEAPDNQNVYSVFINHRSVCQGYARATQYLLQKLGIECALVQGTVDTGETHTWNLVKVDGSYYYVDTTWGDASYLVSGEDSKQLPETSISYDYLCVTTKQLLRTHTLGGCVPMPECEDMAANYYVRENALFSAYDREQLTALFTKAAEEGRTDVTVKCVDSKCYQEMYHMLIEEQEIFDYLGNGAEEVTYAGNDKQLSLTFWLG